MGTSNQEMIETLLRTVNNEFKYVIVPVIALLLICLFVRENLKLVELFPLYLVILSYKAED